MITKGIAGRRQGKVKGVVIHNDAGSNGATCSFYRGYLTDANATNGFAHWYVASDGILQVEDEANMAWHTANSDGNANFIGIEACQSMGNLAQFLDNERRAIKLAAEVLKRHGLQPNTTTVRLHNTFSPTACPHRSQEQHGAGSKTQAYFIAEIKKHMNGSTPSPAKPTTPSQHDKAVSASPAKHQGNAWGKLDYFNGYGKDQIRVAGWLVPDKPQGPIGKYAYVIFMQHGTGKELTRVQSAGIKRPDVKKAYGYQGGQELGFDVTVKKTQFKGKKVDVILRRANKSNGEGAVNDVRIDSIYLTL